MTVSCEEKIQSNSYMDLIVDFEESEEMILVEQDVDSCSIMVNDRYRVWYGDRAVLPPVNMST